MAGYHFLLVALRAIVVSCLALALSLPVLRRAHEAIELGPPPLDGVIVMAVSVLLALLGAGVSGAVLGAWRGTGTAARNSLALLCGLFWGITAAIFVVPSYGSLVAEAVARDAAQVVWSGRSQAIPEARDALELVRSGRRDEAVERGIDAGGREISALGVRSAARLPALALLGWAIVLGPFLCLYEARTAGRKLL